MITRDLVISRFKELVTENVHKKSSLFFVGSKKIMFDPIFFCQLQPKSVGKIAFVDGGNAEVIGTSNLSVQFIRAYAAVYNHNKRI